MKQRVIPEPAFGFRRMPAGLPWSRLRVPRPRRLSHDRQPRVLVLGGGFAALESAFLMRMRMRDQVELTLVSDSNSFGADPQSLLVDLGRPLRRRDVAFERGSVAEVDPDARRVGLADGRTFA